MNMKLFKDGCSKSVYSVPTTTRVFVNNSDDLYIGVTKFYDKGYLFKLESNITRLTKEDAIKDAIELAVDNGFERP